MTAPSTLRQTVRLLAPFFLCVTWLHGQSPVPVVLFAGDVTLSDRVDELVSGRSGYLFDRWTNAVPHDLFMVNLEHPITTSSDKVEKEFNFKLHPNRSFLLLEGRIGLVNLANNHMGDFGPEGIRQTLSVLDSLGIKHVGAGLDLTRARRPEVFMLGKKRIGFLGYHGRYPKDSVAAGPCIAPRDVRMMTRDIRSLKRQTDAVVVNVHWGVEKATEPEPEQRRVARALIDAGADLVVGHHPHVLQGIERYGSGIVAYSLGNFIFGGHSRHTYETAVLRAEFGDELRVEVIPVYVHRYRPSLADSITHRRVVDSLQSRSKIFSKTIPQLGLPVLAQ